MLLMATLDCHIHLEGQYDCSRCLIFQWVLLRSHGLKQSLLFEEKKQGEVWKEGMVNKICWDLLLSFSTTQLHDFYCQQQLLHEVPQPGWSFCSGLKVPKMLWSFYPISSLGCPLKWNIERRFCGNEYGWLQYDADSIQLKSHRTYVKIGRWCRTHVIPVIANTSK